MKDPTSKKTDLWIVVQEGSPHYLSLHGSMCMPAYILAHIHEKEKENKLFGVIKFLSSPFPLPREWTIKDFSIGMW